MHVLFSHLSKAAILASTLLWAATAAAQSVTGPPAAPTEAVRSNEPPAWSAGVGPAGGPDIRANIATNAAQNETSLKVNPLNELNWVGVANDYSLGQVQTGWYTTLDGGQTWTTGTFGIAPGFSFSGDPCVSFTPDGVVTVVFMQYSGPGGSAVSSHTSQDGGLTWGPRQTISLAVNNDKPQVDADRSNGPNRGDLTAAWIRFTDNDNVFVSTSADPTVGWGTAKRINGPGSNRAIAADVTYGPNSALYIMWADRQRKIVWFDRSFDGGQTYTTDVQVKTFTSVPSPIPGSAFRMFDIFSVSADTTTGPYGGNIYIAYHTWNGTHADVRCVRSSDQGTTWPQDVLVNAGDTSNADQVMPGIRVDERGNVNIGYYDRRLDPNNRLLWTWISRSSDGGQTFTDYQASDVGWNHLVTEFGGSFIGDYTDLDCGKNAVLPFWADGRTGTQDVYVDYVTLDFFSDVSSISAATGGTANFTVNLGPNLSGNTYVMAATVSGTSPGTPIGNGVTVPLVFDALTTLSLALANSPTFPNSFGTLDAQGNAAPQLVLGPLLASTVGANLDFAVAAFASGNPVFATNATRVTIAP